MAGAPADDPPPPDISAQFSLEEYRSLRAEIAALMLENQTIERYAGAACAAITAWLLTTTSISGLSQAIAWLIPVTIAGLAALRALGLAKRLRQIGTYIRKKEATTFRGTGWESFLDNWPRTYRVKPAKQPQFHKEFLISPRQYASFLKQKLSFRSLRLRKKLNEFPFEWTARVYWISLIAITGILALFGVIHSLSSTRPDQTSIKIDLPIKITEQNEQENTLPPTVTTGDYRLELKRISPSKQ